MSVKIKLLVNGVELQAELFDTECAKAIVDALPIERSPNTWGDEFYFEVPVRNDLDQTATTKVKIGDIGYWPPGNALAVFFGPTPISTTAEPVPASEVNIVGKIIGDATILRKVNKPLKIRLERL